MNIPKKALAVLLDAERQLRNLIASAAATGEYDAIQRITDWARILGTMVREAQQIESAEIALGNKAAASTSSGIIEDASVEQGSAEDRQGQRGINTSDTRRVQRSPAKREYPKFFKQDNQLVKIGWSRTTKGEYEHKAPRRVVDALTATIARRSRKGKLFTVEDLLPLKDLQDHSEIPSYQAYVVLAWLKRGGLVKQHGRRGYSVRNSSRLADAAITSWQQLPEKSS